MKRRTQGVTLVELMLAVLLMGLLLAPLFLTFHSSTRTSLRGVRQIDQVMEGQRLLKRLREDLRAACLVLPEQTGQVRFDDLVEIETATDSAATSISFLRFPLPVPVDKAISADRRSGPAPRLASRVTYRAEPLPDGAGGLQLSRRESFHPALGLAPMEAILTRNLNFFRVAPLTITDSAGTSRKFFQITMQLVSTRDGRPLPATPPAGTPQQEGLLIADFYDLVCPDFFAALWRAPCQGRSWYSGLARPDPEGR
ncbi:MAG: hypothetical protein GX442_25395 [Candidatus Riflebacteria bacterium]|nr:hypothetical protein [Candidatus Riflebacteria bacterium]